MKTFVIMANDQPKAAVQCNTIEEARDAATQLARKEFEKNKRHWEHECNKYIGHKPKRNAFDYYRRRVFWRPFEMPLLEMMSGRLVSIQEEFKIHTHGSYQEH